jgi:PPM family protein phosphatase
MVTTYKLTAATGIHKGDRPYQQDQVAFIPHIRARGCALGVVADGMGGRSGGRKASDQVMMTAIQLFERYAPDTDDASEILKQMALEAHTVIKLTAISSEQEPHSTIAAFLINSKDHSHVQALIDNGELTEKEAEVHPLSNILTSCLGIENEPAFSVHSIPDLQPGDILMACSDGLWHYFNTGELGMVLSSLTPREAAEFLVKKARERARGGGDNLSLVIAKMEETSEILLDIL